MALQQGGFKGGLEGFLRTNKKDIHIMPNIWAQSYQASGVDADVVPRVIVYYKF